MFKCKYILLITLLFSIVDTYSTDFFKSYDYIFLGLLLIFIKDLKFANQKL